MHKDAGIKGVFFTWVLKKKMIHHCILNGAGKEDSDSEEPEYIRDACL
jgi:hypothetical protein